MSLAAPAALLLAVLAVPLVLLYMLKPQRVPVTVASHLLWRAVAQEVEAQSPWQRLRRSLLLLLELLLLVLLVLALAVPLVPASGAPGGDIVLVLDTSQSMAASDVAPSRFDRARQRATEVAAGLSPGRRVALITAGPSPAVALPPTDDASQLAAALARLSPPHGAADNAGASRLAQAVAARLSQPTVLWIGDGGGALTGPEPLTYPVRYEQVGLGGGNAAITTLAVRSGPAGRQGWVSIGNYGAARPARLSLRVDGELVDGRDLQLAADSQTGVELNDVPPGRVVEAELDGHDFMSADDRAWYVESRDRPIKILLAGPRSRFLEKALALVEGVEVSALPEGQPLPSGFDVYALNGSVPARLPTGNVFILGPTDSPLLRVTGEEQSLAVTSQQSSHPILRYVDLSTVRVARASRMSLPPWMTVLAVSGSVPLLAAGEDGGRRVVALAFTPEQSDLPLQVAFPLLVDNTLRYLGPDLVPGSLARATGSTIDVPAGGPYTLTLPDGTATTVTGGSTFVQAFIPGVYELRAQDGRAVTRFAVNAGDRYESDLRPTGARPGQRQPDSETQVVPPAMQQRWLPVALLALLLLLVEWAAYLRTRAPLQRSRAG